MNVGGVWVDAGTVATAAAASFAVVALACAAGTDAGRRALAELGIALARLALRLAERSAAGAGDDRRRMAARAGLRSIRR